MSRPISIHFRCGQNTISKSFTFIGLFSPFSQLANNVDRHWAESWELLLVHSAPWRTQNPSCRPSQGNRFTGCTVPPGEHFPAAQKLLQSLRKPHRIWFAFSLPGLGSRTESTPGLAPTGFPASPPEDQKKRRLLPPSLPPPFLFLHAPTHLFLIEKQMYVNDGNKTKQNNLNTAGKYAMKSKPSTPNLRVPPF